MRQMQYSTTLKLYKPQQYRYHPSMITEYSTTLKLYKPQLSCVTLYYMI